MSSNEAIDRRVLRQAAQWLVRMNSGHATHADQAACERWLAESDAHRQAWTLAGQLRSQFDAVPQGMSEALREASTVSRSRRRTLKALSWLAVAAPAGWLASRLPWQSWSADYRTATGELRSITLVDGSQVTLASDSAMNVSFNAGERRIRLLSGEAMVQTAFDARAIATAFRVQTAEGIVEARGTQFSVRQDVGSTRVAAFRGGVRILPLTGTARMLEQGRCCSFGRDDVAASQALDEREAMWTRGLLFADGMRLGDLVEALSRYRHGMLRCDDDVADLRVSGIYQLGEVDATLDLLQRTYPIRVRSVTPYWIEIESRPSV